MRSERKNDVEIIVGKRGGGPESTNEQDPVKQNLLFRPHGMAPEDRPTGESDQQRCIQMSEGPNERKLLANLRDRFGDPGAVVIALEI